LNKHKHKHGELWFGICNDGKAVGVEVNEKTLRDISQSIEAHIEPRIYPTVEIATIHKIGNCGHVQTI
jgi:ATP-dependent DNA helicase RecG